MKNVHCTFEILLLKLFLIDWLQQSFECCSQYQNMLLEVAFDF